MKVKFLYVVFTMMLLVAPTVMAQSVYDYEYNSQKKNASITFRNSSDYTMTLKIIHSFGGLYTTVSLPAHSSRAVSFSKSGTFKLKIKATPRYGQSSYHDGGKFSVTSTETEWTEGEMTFRMSMYGSGLGPSISAKEFESDK
ncbi:hypothetical protein [Phocaeicola plebeius]|uniref:hypothetical protein n=1 Tax=Phocaeicola plebeius TaxID=310297 RepID=UPI00294311AE|nr:hypothetical protein [Phocaeicola plebeius]